MLGHVTGLSGVREIMAEEPMLTADKAAALEAMVQRRLTHEPLQHILGRTWFYGLEILCDDRALIPRPDSETVVEAALALLPEDRPVRVADLGTGTGCLLAAVLSQRPEARGVGVEASPEAASLARENLAALGLGQRTSLFVGRWEDWAGWPETDLVLSNPPYIPSRDIESLSPEVRDHDPRAALDGGPDGLAAYHSLVSLAARGLRPGAWLVLETGHDQREAVSELLVKHGFSAIASARDLGGHDRAVWARRPPAD